MKPDREPGLDTRAVHGPHLGDTGPMSTPIVHSATFSFETLEDMVAAQNAGSAGSVDIAGTGRGRAAMVGGALPG